MQLGLWIALLGAAGPAAAAQTADALIAKNIEARGGLEKLQAIQSMRLTGTLSIGDATMPSLLEVKRPNKTRWEFTLDGQTVVQAYDGTVAWAVVPFTGKPEPQRMSAEDWKDMELQADMDGPLVNYQAKGHRVEVMGVEKLGGGEAWRLKVTLRNGDVRDIYLDLKTHLQVLTVARRTIEGKEVEVASEVGDYRRVMDVMLPHSFETKARGITRKQSVRFEKIDINVAIDDSRFAMPVAKTSQTQVPEPEPWSGAPKGR